MLSPKDWQTLSRLLKNRKFQTYFINSDYVGRKAGPHGLYGGTITNVLIRGRKSLRRIVNLTIDIQGSRFRVKPCAFEEKSYISFPHGIMYYQKYRPLTYFLEKLDVSISDGS